MMHPITHNPDERETIICIGVSCSRQLLSPAVVAAQWSAGGAACKEEDLGHQASVGGRLWKPSVVVGGLWTLAFSIWRTLEACSIAKGGDFGG